MKFVVGTRVQMLFIINLFLQSAKQVTYPEKTHADEDHIAIIFDSGAIMPTDEDQDGLMDEEELIRSSLTYHTFMDVLNDSHVKGIVYRISSPGENPLWHQKPSPV